MNTITCLGQGPGAGNNYWRSDECFEKDGMWYVGIGMHLPGKHPLWTQYLIWGLDLHQYPNRNKPILYRNGMTHEVQLYALDPNSPIDWSAPLFGQPLVPLQPANHIYQFRADDNRLAYDRIFNLVRLMMNNQLSPDTDFTRSWDELFHDGVSLKMNVYVEVERSRRSTKH